MIWYLVRWKGYDPDNNSWVEMEKVQKNTWELINEFNKNHSRSAGKKIQRIKMEFPMSMFPKSHVCPTPPPDPEDTEPVDWKFPLEQKLIQMMIKQGD